MIPRGLAVAVIVGIAAVAAFGLVFVSDVETEQPVFVEEPFVSIVTEKTDFAQGETVVVEIVNSGASPLVFPNTAVGFGITQPDGAKVWSYGARDLKVTLEPGAKTAFVWDQTDNDGKSVSPGTYDLSISHSDAKESIPINILPGNDAAEKNPISIITEKNNFELGESVQVRVINSGETTLSHPDTSWGFYVSRVDGAEDSCSIMAGAAIVELEPGHEKTFVWPQTDSCGNAAYPGIYKISAMRHAEKLIAINMPPDDRPTIDASLAIVTAKTDFEQGETVVLEVVNSGASPLVFPNTAVGFSITQPDGVKVWSYGVGGSKVTLQPGAKTAFVWDQRDLDGKSVSPGTYDLNVSHPDAKKSISINILPGDGAIKNNSMLVITEKDNFELGEPVRVSVINSGENTVSDSYMGWGFYVDNADGIEAPCEEEIVREEVSLSPGREKAFVWDQTDSCGNQVLPGIYQVSALGSGGGKLITVNIPPDGGPPINASLSIVTEKDTFELGEEIKIRVVNFGAAPITFFDSKVVLGIEQFDRLTIWSDSNSDSGVLGPGEETAFVWDQTDNDGEPVLPGIYRLYAHNPYTDLVTINILPRNNTEQSDIVDGKSISIVTETDHFELGETVHIRITNTGTAPFWHPTYWNTFVSRLDNAEAMCFSSSQNKATRLDPGKEITLAWHQTDSCGGNAYPGIYKITAGDAEKLITVGLLPEEDVDPFDLVKQSAFSVVTDKSDFKQGEAIRVNITNSGQPPLAFNTKLYGFSVTRPDDTLVYLPPRVELFILQPEQNRVFYWDQTDRDGEPVPPGAYNLNVVHPYMEKSIPINILPGDDVEQFVPMGNESISIETEKTDFVQGEPIHIRIINSGGAPLTFPDGVGFNVTLPDGAYVWSKSAGLGTVILEPEREMTLVWNQQKIAGDFVPPGAYKISADHPFVEQSVTINILPYHAERHVLVGGASLSIETEKTDFVQDEKVPIHIINSGTIPIMFPDTGVGFSVTQLNGTHVWSDFAGLEAAILEPGRKMTLVWDQQNVDEKLIPTGIYRLDVVHPYAEKSVTINILPRYVEQPVLVGGASVSVKTEKANFAHGEAMRVRIINSGAAPLAFPDTGVGFSVTQLDGTHVWSDFAGLEAAILESGHEETFVWNQEISDGEFIPPGTYKLNVVHPSAEQSITINILSRYDAEPPVLVGGASLSIEPSKFVFMHGERIWFQAINSGAAPLVFFNLIAGFNVHHDDSSFSPLVLRQDEFTMQPTEEKTLAWDQTYDGELVPPGIYGLEVRHDYAHKLVTVTILPPDDPEPLVLVGGASVSIATEKTDFVQGETVVIELINSGDIPLLFPDTGVGFSVTQLDGTHVWSRFYGSSLTTLSTVFHEWFIWDQKGFDGEPVPPGTYKLSVDHPSAKQTITINILPRDEAMPLAPTGERELLIETEKDHFELGETVYVRITNTGTTTLSHPDTGWGFFVGRINGVLPSCATLVGDAEVDLPPGQNRTFTWPQADACGNQASPGIYKISAMRYAEKLITVGLLPDDDATPSDLRKRALLSILTEKSDFEQREEIKIRVINSGAFPLTFPATNYGFYITHPDGSTLYTPPAKKDSVTLVPGEEKTFVWDQIKPDGELAASGTYNLNVNHPRVDESVTIRILQ